MSAEVERSIPPGRVAEPRGGLLPARRGELVPAVVVGGAVVIGLLVVYLLSNLARENLYGHFVWQADAWLHGSMTIPFPVEGNDYYQDVMPVLDAAGRETGRGLLPFPPLPALVLVPFVAAWGLATNAQLICAVAAALVAGMGFWSLGRLDIRPSTRLATTVFLGLGTVLWYSAAVGTTWFFAHMVACILVFGAVGIGLARERSGDLDWAVAPRWSVDRWLVIAGLLLGLAATARLPVALGGVFFLFVGGGTLRRRALSIAVGAALPLVALLAYNLAGTGHVFNPAYEYLYRYEVGAYPDLGYHAFWSIEDPRYIPQNLAIMLLQPPNLRLDCLASLGAASAFDHDCPVLAPDAVGMSILLTSPAYLLVIPAIRNRATDPVVIGGIAATAFIATLNLMHFSQGWVQFGYRFSLDFVPFLLPVVALGLDGLRGRWRAFAYVLIGVSVVVTFWGVLWRSVFGW
jgi:hypothetical protein